MDMKQIGGRYVTPNIILCDDGFYRWYYDFNMLKNPGILFTVFKVLGLSFGIVWLFVFILALADGDIESALGTIGVFAIIILVFLVIGVIAYLIVAAIYGGSYMVLFEMNEVEIRHIQAPRQFKKAHAMGWIAFFTGALSGSPARMGQGLMVMSKNDSVSRFESVEKVTVRPSRSTIHMDQLFNKNQVYAYPEDFEFVRQFILSHCTKAKVKQLP